MSSRKYPPELRERAVRMVAEVRDQYESEWAAIGAVAELLGIGTAETLRNGSGRTRSISVFVRGRPVKSPRS
ncbi:hypothetical protein GCM10011610_56650 [Nocardia rhizosphaerihabitans]|uniref:Transposase n=1 Tax=Nocardia rhizosphaerihabitans TaxID=1691570 RepID=A0ABQ2KY12_9NOCA|nr:hypothetical protein GCM10011610_56650 [Nocardia rhizosphaerihabitans]